MSYLRSLRLLCQPEWASLGVLADRPCLPRVDDAPAERLDPLERVGDIADREIGQRERIAGAGPAGVDADRGRSRVRLPTPPFAVLPSFQLKAQEPHPEPPRALRIVCGKLDQRQWRA